MQHHVNHLKSRDIFKEGMTSNDVKDGCSAQYHRGSAFYFLSALSYTENITISRMIQATGHGKGKSIWNRNLSHFLCKITLIICSVLF